jgi:hypothetical protein
MTKASGSLTCRYTSNAPHCINPEEKQSSYSYLWKLPTYVVHAVTIMISKDAYPVNPHWRYPYFDVLNGLEWSNDPESNAGRVSLAGMCKGDHPD